MMMYALLSYVLAKLWAVLRVIVSCATNPRYTPPMLRPSARICNHIEHDISLQRCGWSLNNRQHVAGAPKGYTSCFVYLYLSFRRFSLLISAYEFAFKHVNNCFINEVFFIHYKSCATHILFYVKYVYHIH